MEKKSELAVYWLSVGVVSFLAIVVGIALIPLFLIMTAPVVFGVLFILGLCFGAMLHNLINHLEGLEHHHYLFAGLIVPVVGIATLFILLETTAYLQTVLSLSLSHNPLEASLFYLVGFLLPYVYGLFYE